nr:unnamed protein product [Callosobruchus analis]
MTYGSDEFGTSQQPHDGSPRYTSPGGGPAAAPAGYYIGADGAPAPGQPTAAGGAAAAADWPPTPYTAYQEVVYARATAPRAHPYQVEVPIPRTDLPQHSFFWRRVEDV